VQRQAARGGSEDAELTPLVSSKKPSVSGRAPSKKLSEHAYWRRIPIIAEKKVINAQIFSIESALELIAPTTDAIGP
jgi:hypothetical protein